MVAFLAYLPTTLFGEHYIYLLFFAMMIFRERNRVFNDIQSVIDKKGGKLTFSAFLMFAILLLSLVNNLIHQDMILAPKDLIPYMLLMGVTIYLSKFFSKRDALVILGLLSIEILVGVYEFAIGVNTLFRELETFRDQSGSTLLYFKRVFGLSANSSALAEKVLIGLFLLYGFKLFSTWWGKIAFGILMVGVVITFSRTLISTGLVFLLIVAMQKSLVKHRSVLSWSVVLLVLAVGVSLIAFGWIQYGEQFVAEFTRKQGQIEITGRGDIWTNFISFWMNNPVSGNGSYKLWLGEYHAHNSFLQTLASQGLIIFFLLMIFVFRNVNSKNYWIVIPVFFYSLTQYGIFWGVSLFDLVFFHFLLHHYSQEDEKLESSSFTSSSAKLASE